MKKFSVFPILLTCLLVITFTACDNGINHGGEGVQITFVDAKPDKGFNYRYYYYIPSNAKKTTFILVEPNNTGTTSDDMNVHDQRAESLINGRKGYADELGVVLLVPVFPRPANNWQMYTHALDRDTLLNKAGDLARIDLQLIKMIDDLRVICQSEGISIDPKTLMNGFSASGDFVNRFTAIHPDLVQAAVSGGIGFTPLLPIGVLAGETLIYPVGIADIGTIIGTPFNLVQYRNVPQFIYMGSVDDNDSVPYSDAFSDAEREIIYKVLGRDMFGRWQPSQDVYQQQGCNAVTFITYSGVGHTITNAITNDIINFLKDNIK
jgi:hypothetical protein